MTSETTEPTPSSTPTPFPADRASTASASPWGFFLVGIVVLLAGLYALAYPFLATLAVNVVAGTALLVVGIFVLAHTIFLGRWTGRIVNAVSGLIALGIGTLMLVFPAYGIIGMTGIAIAFFLAAGASRLALGLALRSSSAVWGWSVLHGALSIFLGLLLLIALPGIAAWAVGLLIGIDMVFTGAWFLSLSAALSRVRDQ